MGGRKGRLAAVAFLALAALGAVDRLLPPRLPGPGHYARLVTDRRGEPLRAFAGSDGVWRFATTP